MRQRLRRAFTDAPAGRPKIKIQSGVGFRQIHSVQTHEIRPAAWQRRFWYAALTALALVALFAVVAGVIYLVV